MARQARQSFVQRFERLERLVHVQRIRRKGHTESKTFIVGGDDVEVTTSTLIPPLRVGIDHDGETPEWKTLTGMAANLQGGGTATIRVTLNGITVGDAMNIDYYDTVQDLANPLTLLHGDKILVEVDATAGAYGLSVSVFMVTAAR